MVLIWSGGLSALYFLAAQRLGVLRESWEVQIVGIDIAEMSQLDVDFYDRLRWWYMNHLLDLNE
jgi:hypothetical protein